MTNGKANFDIEIYALENGILKWRIAEKLGITDSSFSRKLRHELSDEDKQKIRDIVDKLKGGEENGTMAQH